MTDRMQTVQGRCPACGWTSLFLGDGGHVTCSRLECPNPCAADQLLHGEHVGAATPLVCSDERHAAKVADLERQLDQAREECRNWAEAESADIAAGSYAGRVEELEAALREVLATLYAITRTGDPTPLGYQAIHPIRPGNYQRWTNVLERREAS